MMKKLLLCSLLIFSFLTSCQSEAPVSEPVAVESEDPSLQLIAYYEERLSGLQDELLAAKVELFSQKVSYEEQIEAQKQEIAGLENALSASVNLLTDEPAPSLFSYIRSEKGVIITEYTGSESELTIPATLDGMDVIEIAESVFSGHSELTAVELESGIRKIGWFAFANCANLHTVKLPDTVTSISYGAFSNCSRFFSVICKEDSYAQAFAESNGFAVSFIR